MNEQKKNEPNLEGEFDRNMGLFDATMVVVGSMIGSGIFIVPAKMASELGSPGWLLIAWTITGLLTVSAALSYGELAAMMPRAGGQYLYLREAFSPMVGFLYGWTLFLVIQTGFIAAVAVAFARYVGVLWPTVAENNYLLGPWHVSSGYAVSLSTAQFAGILMIALLTATNICGLRYGKIVQNLFTVAKTGALLGLIVVGFALGWNAEAVRSNFGDLWTARGTLSDLDGGLTAATAFGLFVALCVSQTGSLFSSDTWNNVTFTAGEVRQPRRNLPLSLLLGTTSVIALYLLANLAYLVTLPFADIQQAESGRVATLALSRIFPDFGVPMMAAAIVISTFGCNNGLILAGARAYYAMARDGLFFASAGRLNAARVPAWGLLLQGAWAALLVLPRTYNVKEGKYGNLYDDLLDYIISAALLFYVLTIAGVYRLRRTRPHADRPYRAFGYPLIPGFYLVGATAIVVVLIFYRPMTTWPGMIIVLTGLPVYWLWSHSQSRVDAVRF